MKISWFTCAKCFVEQPEVSPKKYVQLDIRDDGVYEFSCDRGHKTITFMQQDLFEVLFDLGAMALLDGYTREAVSSFAASLERFYEYCIHVLMEHKGIDPDQFDRTWKLVAKQSERQLGAFYFLYLQEFGRVPPALPANCVEFRNNAIHKGRIPTNDEVVNYGKQVYDYIIAVAKDLRERCKSSIHKPFIRRQQDRLNQDANISVMSMATMIRMSLDDANFDKLSFMDSLEQLKRTKGIYYSR